MDSDLLTDGMGKTEKSPGGGRAPRGRPRRRAKSGPTAAPPAAATTVPPSAADVFAPLLIPAGSVGEFYPQAAGRREDWRWQMGLRLAGGLKVPRAWADPGIRRARRFAAAFRVDAAGCLLPAVAARYPVEVETLRLKLTAPPAVRWEVEARVLAGQPAAEIARAVGRPAAVIRLYEDWFFGVRDRLAARSYVLHVVIRWFAVDTAPTTEQIWKFFAFRGGTLVLDAVIRETSDPRPPAGPAGGDQFRTAIDRLLVRAAVLVHTLPAAAMSVTRRLALTDIVRQVRAWLATSPGASTPLPGSCTAWDTLMARLGGGEDTATGAGRRSGAAGGHPGALGSE
jgi:hypothetical protein